MNTLNATQILIGFYIATVLVNIIVSIFQLYVYHTKLSKMVLFYWISILFAAFINGLFPTPNYLSALVSAHLNIVSQSVLGLLLAEMTEVKIKWTKAIYFYFPMIILSGMLYILGFSLEIYAIPIVISCCAFPFFYASYFVLKEKRVPFTLTQKLFFTVAALMSIHFLDYPYFVLRPELFIIGLSIAFVFYHVLSIFIPMLASEHSLVLRNRSLQNEVDERVELLKKANHEIWQSSKRASFGRMAGAIVHEFNNPLTALLMNTERIKNGVEDGSFDCHEIKNSMLIFERSVNQIQQVTDNLRRVSDDHISFDKEEFGLVASISDVVSEFSASVANMGIQFNYKAPLYEYYVHGNRYDLKIALMNVLENAVEAVESLSNKVISLEFEDRFPQIAMVCRDSGKIKGEIIPQMLDPFFSTKQSTSIKGMGLFTVSAIMERHGGRVTIRENEANTCFVLDLTASRREEC